MENNNSYSTVYNKKSSIQIFKIFLHIQNLSTYRNFIIYLININLLRLKFFEIFDFQGTLKALSMFTFLIYTKIIIKTSYTRNHFFQIINFS